MEYQYQTKAQVLCVSVSLCLSLSVCLSLARIPLSKKLVKYFATYYNWQTSAVVQNLESHCLASPMFEAPYTRVQLFASTHHPSSDSWPVLMTQDQLQL
jgi:hypothetical protein